MRSHSLLFGWLILLALIPGGALRSLAQDAAEQEFYELRIYQISDFEKQQICSNYLENALLPALNRAGIEPVGVFTNQDDVNDHSLYMIIPFQDLATFANLSDTLQADEEYQQAASGYFDRPLKDPVYDRIESRLMKAFAGIPKMELPPQSKELSDRVFELRLYQSHTEDHAIRKVAMFNEGEIQIMRDAGLGPVFFGQTLVGGDAPNLIYLLSATDRDAHQEHWKAFLAHPEWKRISQLERFKDTVSKIENWFLVPTRYSQF